jgi:hypothetical protein
MMADARAEDRLRPGFRVLAGWLQGGEWPDMKA